MWDGRVDSFSDDFLTVIQFAKTPYMQDVLIDITRLVHRFMEKRLPTGVDRVSLAYIKHYGPYGRAVLRHNGGKFVFRRAESVALFEWVLTLGLSGSPLPTIYKGLLTGCFAQNVIGHFLFNVGHTGLDSDAYVPMLQGQGVKPIFMVHDLIPITHPQYCRSGERSRHLTRLQNAVRVASGIVCNSNATLQGVQQLCVERGWVMPPAVVALLAPESLGVALMSIPTDPPYFVYVSTIEPRKNHMLLLNAWLKLEMQLGDATPRLVIIGQKGWGYSDVLDLLECSEVLKRLVQHVPDCTDAQMLGYLQHARALLFPSFTEGFGMPIVEALAQGVPVIASDLPVFREFASTVPEYIDVTDENRWIQAIASYSKAQSQPRNDQLSRMVGFVAPTWAEHFSKVDGFLADLALCAIPDA